jgi:hypothetical protein
MMPLVVSVNVLGSMLLELLEPRNHKKKHIISTGKNYEKSDNITTRNMNVIVEVLPKVDYDPQVAQ